MIRDALEIEKINTDADSSLKGIGLQKVRAAERLLRALIDGKRAVLCTIEHIDDVLEINIDGEKTDYCILRHPTAGFAEQNGRNAKLIGRRPLLL